jgi:hypothetical protein
MQSAAKLMAWLIIAFLDFRFSNKTAKAHEPGRALQSFYIRWRGTRHKL